MSQTIEVANFSQSMPYVKVAVALDGDFAHIYSRTGYIKDPYLDRLAIAEAKKLAVSTSG